MPMADEMHRLARQLLNEHDRRTMAVSDMRADVAAELDAFHTARQQMASEERQQRTGAIEQIRVDVDEMRHDVERLLEGSSAAHQAMASEQRRELSEYVTQVRRETGEVLRQAEDLIRDVGDARQEMAVEQAEQLSDYVEGLQQAVSGMQRETALFLEEMQAAQQEMTAEQRQWLGEHVQGLRSDVSAFLETVGATRKAIAMEQHQERVAALQNASAQQQQRLLAERDRLIAEVANMRARFHEARRELQADLGEARQAWSSLSVLMQQRQGRKQTVPLSAEAVQVKTQAGVVQPSAPAGEPAQALEATPAAMPQEWAEPEALKERMPAADDLAAIRGIGPSTQETLNAAGICTYAQLARETPDRLRELLGSMAALAKVEDWIAQARAMDEPG